MTRIAQLEADFAKADAEHTAASERLQQTANRRQSLLIQLADARVSGESRVASDEKVMKTDEMEAAEVETK